MNEDDEELSLNTKFEQFQFDNKDDVVKDSDFENRNPFRKDPADQFLQKLRGNELDSSSVFTDYLDPKILLSNGPIDPALQHVSGATAVKTELEQDLRGGTEFATAMENNASKAESTNDGDAHMLHKASSVPHLHSPNSKLLKPNQTSSPRRKKTSEANGIPDPVMFNDLLHENQMLKDKIAKDEEGRKKIVSINHAWDAQYNLLTQKYTALEGEAAQAQVEQNAVIVNKDKEIAARDKKIARLTKKIEVFINGCDDKDDKPLWEQVDENEGGASSAVEDTKKTKEVRKDEFSESLILMEQILAQEKEDKKMAVHQAKDLKRRCQYLENALHQQTKQSLYLQTELQRLTGVIEKSHENKKKHSTHESSPRMTSTNTDFEGDELKEVELLKQQLQVYAEDFNAEKEDKQKIIEENEELKKKFTRFTEEKEHLLRQLQIYEEDFYREREKRINLMRRNGNSTPVREEYPTPRHQTPLSSQPEDDPQQRWKEYCCLVVEKEQLSDRITELESQGVTRYNGRHQPVAYPHYLPRGRAQPSNQSSANSDISHFYSGSVVRDARSEWSPSMYNTREDLTPSESDYRMPSKKKLYTKSRSPLP